uniref:WxxW domain-containing protein n=1 Tax=Plectus sambesii TaxID=2011161 RepID=A0A914WFR7_9BILA
MIIWCSLLVGFSLLPASLGFSCGSSAIPFRLEVLQDGTPILGCATPNCFGGGEGGIGFDPETQANAAVEGKDGLQREQDLDQDRWRHPNAEPQRAECFFSSAGSCPDNHWVGGLSGNKASLEIQCCKYKGLAFSKVLTKSVVRPGEVFTGGEVLLNDRQTQFDLISDVRKVIADDGKISYKFSVTRMHCIPDAPEKTIEVHASADDIVAVLSGQANPVGLEEPRRQAAETNPLRTEQGLEPLSSGGAKAFQGNIPQQFNGQGAAQQGGSIVRGQLRGGTGRLIGYEQQRPTSFVQPRITGYNQVQVRSKFLRVDV